MAKRPRNEIKASDIAAATVDVADIDTLEETLPANVPIVVETHAQAAEINATRTAEQGYVKVGDTVGG